MDDFCCCLLVIHDESTNEDSGLCGGREEPERPRGGGWVPTQLGDGRRRYRSDAAHTPHPVSPSPPPAPLHARPPRVSHLRENAHGDYAGLPATSAVLILIISMTAALLLESDCCCNLLRCSLKSLCQAKIKATAMVKTAFNQHQQPTESEDYQRTCSAVRGSLILCKPLRADEGGTTSFYTGHSPQKLVFYR